MTYLGQENDFSFLDLFEADVRHLFGALPPCNAFFTNFDVIFLLLKNCIDLHAIHGRHL